MTDVTYRFFSQKAGTVVQRNCLFSLNEKYRLHWVPRELAGNTGALQPVKTLSSYLSESTSIFINQKKGG